MAILFTDFPNRCPTPNLSQSHRIVPLPPGSIPDAKHPAPARHLNS